MQTFKQRTYSVYEKKTQDTKKKQKKNSDALVILKGLHEGTVRFF